MHVSSPLRSFSKPSWIIFAWIAPDCVLNCHFSRTSLMDIKTCFYFEVEFTRMRGPPHHEMGKWSHSSTIGSVNDEYDSTSEYQPTSDHHSFQPGEAPWVFGLRTFCKFAYRSFQNEYKHYPSISITMGGLGNAIASVNTETKTSFNWVCHPGLAVIYHRYLSGIATRSFWSSEVGGLETVLCAYTSKEHVFLICLCEGSLGENLHFSWFILQASCIVSFCMHEAFWCMNHAVKTCWRKAQDSSKLLIYFPFPFLLLCRKPSGARGSTN